MNAGVGAGPLVACVPLLPAGVGAAADGGGAAPANVDADVAGVQVGVGVGVRIGVGVRVGIRVAVRVGVTVRVAVRVRVAVGVGIRVGVRIRVGFDHRVGGVDDQGVEAAAGQNANGKDGQAELVHGGSSVEEWVPLEFPGRHGLLSSCHAAHTSVT